MINSHRADADKIATISVAQWRTVWDRSKLYVHNILDSNLILLLSVDAIHTSSNDESDTDSSSSSNNLDEVDGEILIDSEDTLDLQSKLVMF